MNLRIKEIQQDGRGLLLKCRNGNAILTTEVSPTDFNRMMGMACEHPDREFLNALRKHATEQLKKGKGLRKFWPETIDHLKEGYATFFGMPWERIMRKDRHQPFAAVRQHVYAHLLHLGYEEPEIAIAFADRHRTTILEAIQTWKDRQVEDGYNFKAKLLFKFMGEWLCETE